MIPTECFWCPLPPVRTVNGVPLCDSHAICSTCLKALDEEAQTCVCDDYGYAGHEEWLFCSEDCLQAQHPAGDLEVLDATEEGGG